MGFQIAALPESLFRDLFELTDAQLEARSARRLVVDAKPGYPCRVSLADADIGETVILVNYAHHDRDTPYRSRHAVFVRQGAVQAQPAPGEVPEVLRSRLLSVRAFNARHDMVAADVIDGAEVESLIATMFADSNVEYLHLHNAKPGCFAARVTRAPSTPLQNDLHS